MKNKFGKILGVLLIVVLFVCGCFLEITNKDKVPTPEVSHGTEKADESATVALSDVEAVQASSETSSQEASAEEAGDIVGNNPWDGIFVDELGIKVHSTMTINEIVEQGCLVFTDYKLEDENLELIKKAPSEMIIPPKGYFTSDPLYVWKEVDGSYEKSDFSEKLWFYNPYPYAVTLGECRIGQVIGGTRRIPKFKEWDTDQNGKVTKDELIKAMGTPTGESEDGELMYYIVDGYYFHFWDYEGRSILDHVTETFLGDSPDYESKIFPDQNYESVTFYEEESESAEFDGSYVFAMSLGKYEIDLSFLESVDFISRDFIPQSGHSTELNIYGTTKDGKKVRIEITNPDFDSYYSIRRYVYYTNGGLDRTSSSGETYAYYLANPNVYYSLALDNQLIIGIAATGGDSPEDVDYDLALTDEVVSHITVKEE